MKPPPLKPRISRLNRAILSIAILLVVGIPLSHFLWGVWAEHRLNQTLAELHAGGEPVTAEQLRLDSVPDAENASLDYKAAEDLIDGKTANWRVIDDSLNRDFQTPLTVAELKTVNAIVAEDSAALSLTAAARGKSPGAWVVLGAREPLAPLAKLEPVRQLCRLLKLAAMSAHSAGRSAKVLQRRR